MSQLVFGHSIGVIDLVAQNDEGDLGQLFQGQKGVELSFGFGQAFMVLGIDEENDTIDLGKIISPNTTG